MKKIFMYLKTKVKYTILRTRVGLKNKAKKVTIDNVIKEELNDIQQSSIKLWNKFLNDKSARIYSNSAATNRQIDSTNFMVILETNQENYKISTIDIEKKSCFEVIIPINIGDDLASKFDIENERRMRGIEHAKKLIIRGELDSLIKSVN